jgi:hypothetical protein
VCLGRGLLEEDVAARDLPLALVEREAEEPAVGRHGLGARHLMSGIEGRIEAGILSQRERANC